MNATYITQNTGLLLASRIPVPTLRRQRIGKSRLAYPPTQWPTLPTWLFIEDETDASNSNLAMDAPSFQFEPFFRVILHFSEWSEGKQIAKLVRIAVPIISSTESIRVVEMAELHTKSIVVTVKKDEAELYVQRLLVAGLIASMEEA